MVTQIYTAPIRVRTPHTAGQASPMAASAQASASEASIDRDDQGPSQSPLSAVEEQSRSGVISIEAVINDFQNTMDALGVPPEVKDDVYPYLKVVAHQAQKPQPSSGLIKQNLKAASDTLDHYITDALGQPSKVVRDWVDALLMQPINYQAQQGISLNSPSVENQPVFQNGVANPMSTSASFYPQKPPRRSLTDDEKTYLGSQFTQIKQAFEDTDITEAERLHNELLETFAANEHPDVSGRIHYQYARISDSFDQPELARSHYIQAIEQFQHAQLPKAEAKAHLGLGQNLTQNGLIDDALAHLTAASSLAATHGDDQTASQAFWETGKLYAEHQQAQKAAELWQKALHHSEHHSPEEASPILKALGELYRNHDKPAKAFDAYRRALSIDQQLGNEAGVKTSLQGLASLYLSQGNSEKAYQLLAKVVQ